MKVLEKLHGLGKKVSDFVKKGLSLGSKATEKVSSINDKVKTYSKIASKISPLLPKEAQDAISKVNEVSNKVSEGTKMARKGLERGQELQGKVSKISGVGDAISVGKEAYFSGKNAVSSTRTFLDRPKRGDKISGSGQKVLQPGVSTAKKALERVRKDTIGASAVRGVGRPSDDANFAKALKAAQMAQGIMKKGRKKK